jgi:hypothetical protein
MPDPSYQPKVYRKQGGDAQVIAAAGEVEVQQGGKIRDDQPEQSSLPSIVFMHDIAVPHSTAATPQTVNLTIEDRMQIVDVQVLKTGGGASGTTVSTVQVQTSTGGAITNAIDAKVVDKTVVRAGTIDDALAVRAAGGVIRVVRSGSIGAGAGAVVSSIVRVFGVKRST